MNLVMEGDVIFNNLDPLVGRFELERNKNFVGNRRFDVPAVRFPENFDVNTHDVIGRYKIEIAVKKKRK